MEEVNDYIYASCLPMNEDKIDIDYFIWEEYDYSSNSMYYEYELEELESQPKRDKTNAHKASRCIRNLQS